jgi:hypothetical protein
MTRIEILVIHSFHVIVDPYCGTMQFLSNIKLILILEISICPWSSDHKKCLSKPFGTCVLKKVNLCSRSGFLLLFVQ